MPTTTYILVPEGQTAQVRPDLPDGTVVRLQIRVTPGTGAEVEVALPAQGSVASEPQTAEERAASYRTPEFRQRLIEHLTEARNAALTDHQVEGQRNGRP